MGLRFRAVICVMVLLWYGSRAADDTSCISALAPCSNYLNSTTKPPSSCCAPLVSVINKDPQCLCNLLSSSTVKQLGINVTQAMELPAKCGQNATASQCNKSSGGGNTTSTGGTTSPAGSGSSNAASRLFSVEILPLAALVLAVVASQVP